MKSMLFAGAALTAIMPIGSAFSETAAPVNWTGGFIGLQAGLGSGHTNWTDTSPDGDIDATMTGQTASSDMNGGIYGGQIGFDYQCAGHWVIGVQGEIARTDMSGTNQDQFNSTWTLKTRSDWIATATARIGWASNDVLLYGRGGVAVMRNSFDIENDGFDLGTTAQTRVGFVIAPGIAWRFSPNWSAFTEFGYYQFGGKDMDFPGNVSPAATTAGANTPAFQVRTTQNIQSLKFGLNYHF